MVEIGRRGKGVGLKAAKAVIYWILFLGYLAGLFWASHQPDTGPVGVYVWDKLVHAAAYFGLVIFARIALGTVLGQAGLAVVSAALVAILYGAADEWMQRLTPTREADINDWIADSVGAVAAGLLLLSVGRMRRGSTKDISA